MRILQIRYTGLLPFEDDLTVDFTAGQRVDVAAREYLIPVTDKVYASPVLALAGLNATGKTLTLDALRFAFALAAGESLHHILDQKCLLEMTGADPVRLTLWFFQEGQFRVYTAEIGRQDPEDSQKSQLILKKEALYAQKRTLVRKTDWKQDPQSEPEGFYRCVRTRNEPDESFTGERSLCAGLTEHPEERLMWLDEQSPEEDSTFSLCTDWLPALLSFLDPGIEVLQNQPMQTLDQTVLTLKWTCLKKECQVRNWPELESVLSQGTGRGIRLFVKALRCFENGGCLLVDELEVHLNLEIVRTLIRFFLDPSINQNGGVLVFTTHAPSLLDELPRNDAVYILRRTGKISCTNLSRLLVRNDGIRKSEAFVSDFLQGTAPSYEKYLVLKKSIPLWLSRRSDPENSQESD